MPSPSDIQHRFPAPFRAATHTLWPDRAPELLAGALQSIDATRAVSEVAALIYMRKTLGLEPFLNETGMKTLVHGKGSKTPPPVVDFVAETAERDGLVLVEAKLKLDSEKLRDGKMVAKFAQTMAELERYYREGGQICPPMKRALVTARPIAISGRSTSSVVDGVLLRQGQKVLVGAALCQVEVVEV